MLGEEFTGDSNNIYDPETFPLEMWNDEDISDISNTYKMDFISALSSSIDVTSYTYVPNPIMSTTSSSSSDKFDNNLQFSDISSNSISHEEPAYSSPATSNTDSYDSVFKNWEEIPVKQWSCTDVCQWLKNTLYSIESTTEFKEILEIFKNVDGLVLSCMCTSDFITFAGKFGNFLYDKLQDCIRLDTSVPELHQLLPIESSYKDIPSDVVSLMLSESQLNFSEELRSKLNKELQSSANDLPACLTEDFLSEGKQEEKSTYYKKKPGRPRSLKRRKQREQRLGRLWEFIRDLLLSDKYCPKYICWDNYEEGKFRFVESDKVAKLWGSIKGNANMNYEKFSRAMRYYYKSEVLLPVEGRRLVYKFGPKATGWRTNNPNFKF